MVIILHTKKFIQYQMLFGEISSNSVLKTEHEKLIGILEFFSGKVGKIEGFTYWSQATFLVSWWMGDIIFQKKSEGLPSIH